MSRTPQSIAAQCEGQSWTYAELNARADRVAARLTCLGVRPGVVVGLCVERSLVMLAALLGVLKAGGAYLPLDPANPQHRLDFILQDSGIGLLVTQEAVLSRLRFKGQAADTDQFRARHPACGRRSDGAA